MRLSNPDVIISASRTHNSSVGKVDTKWSKAPGHRSSTSVEQKILHHLFLRHPVSIRANISTL